MYDESLACKENVSPRAAPNTVEPNLDFAFYFFFFFTLSYFIERQSYRKEEAEAQRPRKRERDIFQLPIHGPNELTQAKAMSQELHQGFPHKEPKLLGQLPLLFSGH